MPREEVVDTAGAGEDRDSAPEGSSPVAERVALEEDWKLVAARLVEKSERHGQWRTSGDGRLQYLVPPE